MPLSLSSTSVTNFQFSKDSQYVSYTKLDTTSDLKNATIIVKLDGMAIRVVEFSSEGYKIRKIFA